MKLNDLYMAEGPHDPHIFKVIFMVGGPGAGKSSVAQHIVGGTGLKHTDVDTVYELLMRKQDMSKFDPETHDDALRIHYNRRTNYIDGRLGLVLDGTGRHYDVIADMKRELEDIGYDTAMIYVNTDPKVAAARIASGRSRKVDPHFLNRTHRQLTQNLGKFQSLFGNNLIIVDNSDDNPNWGDMSKRVSKFLQEPLSPVAKDWVSGK